MKFIIIALIFTTLLHSSHQLLCNVGDPCLLLTAPYTVANGYGCQQLDASNVLCKCPNGGYELNTPCRLCNRTNPVNNVCNPSAPGFLGCYEGPDYGTKYACFCLDPFSRLPVATADSNCQLTVTLTSSTTTTTTTTPNHALVCLNGGVFVNGFCNCPSGYTGTVCGQKIDADSCNRIICKNNGVCAIRNPSGPYEGVCLCRYATWGDYCERNGISSACSSSTCLNGGVCKENTVGTTRFAYCFCAPGYKGINCDTRYFICPSAGRFADVEMFEQGKYFECTNAGGSLVITQRSCPKGLRFSANYQLCSY